MRALVPLLVVLALLLFLVPSVAFIVTQTEQVVVTRFGKPIGEPITEPGLRFKMPFVDNLNRFDKRFLEWDGIVTQVPTKEKRFILVDTYARWRIIDPLLFFQRLRDEAGGRSRLDGIINGETRDAVARHDVIELVRTTNREPLEGSAQTGEEDAGLAPIKVGRETVRKEILKNAQARVTDLGIEILDVQFKRINYVSDVERTVFNRMIAERKRIADRFRSEGQGEASRIRGDRERDLKEIQSEAYRQAQEIVGRADAEATEIYASAYNQSAEAREFYAFLKTMESYASAIGADTTLVLSTKSDFFSYLKEGR
jgi:membrane protease subunit HflC